MATARKIIPINGGLSASMTLRAFDNGYWYATELREFAVEMKIPAATKLRKDQLEAAIKNLLRANQGRWGPSR